MKRALCGILLLLSSGCSAFQSLHLDTLGVSAQRPSQVALYVSITDDGKPVTDLSVEAFKVYEDGQQLSAAQTQQVLLDRDLVAAHHTLLLVDNSLATEASVRKELASAIGIFVERVRSVEPVSVYAFDGGTEIHLVADFPQAEKAGAPDLRRLSQLVPEDTSRNLNGAVEQAALKLDERLRERRQPIKVGTLVVFSGGPDLAGRGSEDKAENALRDRKFTVLSIGIGAEISELRAIGEAGYVDAHSADTVSLAFEDAAHRVHDAYEQYYLFAYCSPARAGTRQLQLEIERTEKDGSKRTADSSAEFDATGFSAGCNPRATPRFEAARKTR